MECAPPKDSDKCKEFIIDLDTPPTNRWAEIGRIYGDNIKEAIKLTTGTLPSEVINIADFLGKELETLLPSPYKEEIQGFADVIGIPVGELFFLNLAYDLTAHCTSIVAQTSDGKILHARNLDTPRDPGFQKLMGVTRKSTFIVHFQEQGKTIYSGVTTAGYIGLLTGQKPNTFTITLDERRTGNVWLNIMELLKDHPGASVGLVIRDTLADPDINFEGVVEKLTYIPLIAACYFIIGGINPGEGAVITRDRKEAVQPLSNGVWRLNSSPGQWYVLETNNDHWTKLPNIQPPNSNKDSYDRQNTGDKTMNDIGQENMNPTALIKVLSTPPVYNQSTLYTAVMSAAEPSLFTAWIRFPKASSSKKGCVVL